MTTAPGCAGCSPSWPLKSTAQPPSRPGPKHPRGPARRGWSPHATATPRRPERLLVAARTADGYPDRAAHQARRGWPAPRTRSTTRRDRRAAPLASVASGSLPTGPSDAVPATNEERQHKPSPCDSERHRSRICLFVFGPVRTFFNAARAGRQQRPLGVETGALGGAQAEATRTVQAAGSCHVRAVEPNGTGQHHSEQSPPPHKQEGTEPAQREGKQPPHSPSIRHLHESECVPVFVRPIGALPSAKSDVGCPPCSSARSAEARPPSR
jgi:hypothetical protein